MMHKEDIINTRDDAEGRDRECRREGHYRREG